MKTAQLIKKEQRELYIENGVVLSLNPTEKLAHMILGKENKTIVTEEVVCRFRATTRKEFDTMFWKYMETEKADFRDYYLVID